MLEYLGEDTTREGLRNTPTRIVKMWDEIYGGYKQDIAELMTVFTSPNPEADKQIILLRDIELYSTCEHHLMPFIGRAHIAYIPDGKVIGVSKLARILDAFARRLQIQERLGDQVTSALMEHLAPLGAACVIEAYHLCMRMRGVGKQNSTMVTSSMKGVFLEEPATRAELMSLINNGRAIG